MVILFITYLKYFNRKTELTLKYKFFFNQKNNALWWRESLQFWLWPHCFSHTVPLRMTFTSQIGISSWGGLSGPVRYIPTQMFPRHLTPDMFRAERLPFAEICPFDCILHPASWGPLSACGHSRTPEYHFQPPSSPLFHRSQQERAWVPSIPPPKSVSSSPLSLMHCPSPGHYHLLPGVL